MYDGVTTFSSILSIKLSIYIMMLSATYEDKKTTGRKKILVIVLIFNEYVSFPFWTWSISIDTIRDNQPQVLARPTVYIIPGDRLIEFNPAAGTLPTEYPLVN